VLLVHRTLGLPERIPLRRLDDTGPWYVVVELPEGSRIEYQLEVVQGGDRQRVNDPLNPRLAHSPLGSSSVCYAHGYEVPEWTRPNEESRPGRLVDLVVPAGRCAATAR
jgi:enterochelin esterase family protein